MSEKHLVSLSDIEEASKRLTGIIRPTVMVHAGWLERQINQPVYLKPENLQRAGSFKIRGAYNLMSQLSEEDKKKGVVAASAGNHAQGVALAAQLLGIKSKVYMPVSASIPKFWLQKVMVQMLNLLVKQLMFRLQKQEKIVNKVVQYLYLLLIILILWQDKEPLV